MATCTTCSTTYSTDCITYSGTTNCFATNGDTLSVVISSISSLLCDTYDISCFSTSEETAATLPELLASLITEVCELGSGSPIFDTTCLGGTASDTTQQAVGRLISNACLTTTFDTTCMTGGSLTENLPGTINRLITTVCSVPEYTLDWGCLDGIAEEDLQSILENILANITTNRYLFTSDHFVVTGSDCEKTVNIDIDKLVDILKINSDLLIEILNYVEENLTYNMFAGDGCTRNYLADSFIFDEGLTGERVCNPLYRFRMDAEELHNTASVFTGITMPSGVKYTTSTPIPVSSTTAIADWLTANIDIPSPTVSLVYVNPTYTLRVIIDAHGDPSTATPILHTKYNVLSQEKDTGVVESVLMDEDDICCALKVSLSDPIDQEILTPVCRTFVGEDDIVITNDTLTARVYTIVTSSAGTLTSYTDETATNTVAGIALNNQSALESFFEALNLQGKWYVNYDSGAGTTTIEYQIYLDKDVVPTDPYFEINAATVNYDSALWNSNDTCNQVTVGRPTAEGECPVDVVGYADNCVDYTELSETTWSFYYGEILPANTVTLEYIKVFNRIYTPPAPINLYDKVTMLAWLNGLGVGTWTYPLSFTNPTYAVTFGFTGFVGSGVGDQYEFVPRFKMSDSTSLSTMDYVSATGESCSKFVVTTCVPDWIDVSDNGSGWDVSEIQFRVRSDGRVEVKGGTISKTFNSSKGCKIYEDAFQCPTYNALASGTRAMYGEFEAGEAPGSPAKYHDKTPGTIGTVAQQGVTMYQAGLEQTAGTDIFKVYFAASYYSTTTNLFHCKDIGTGDTVRIFIPDFHYYI